MEVEQFHLPFCPSHLHCLSWSFKGKAHNSATIMTTFLPAGKKGRQHYDSCMHTFKADEIAAGLSVFACRKTRGTQAVSTLHPALVTELG